MTPAAGAGKGTVGPGGPGFHPLANLFPLIEEEDRDALAEDIRVHGLREPIVLLDGLILDGRNRFRALQALRDTGELRGEGWGIYAGEAVTDETLEVDPGNPLFARYSSLAHGDPLAFVLSRNLHRRHLDESQRAMVAARLATMRQGARTDRMDPGLRRGDGKGGAEPPANLPEVDQAAAAAALNVSERSLRSARMVQEKGTPELVRAVEQGRLAVSAAAKAAALPAAQQARIAAEAEAGRGNAVLTLIKQEDREQREADLAARQTALPARRYGVILADPEWRFEPWSRDSGMDRAADNHYPTSETAIIAARPVGDIAVDDCVLFLWATAPMLPDALAVMAAWGFRYVTNFAWTKDRTGTGYWNRNRHELLLVGTRGSVPAPAPGTQWPSVIAAPAGRHSEKPEAVYELIEAYFPRLPKIELNARARRPGWDAWGNEAPAEGAADPVPEEAPSSPGPGEGDHPKDGGRGAPVAGFESPGGGFESSISPPTAFGGPPSIQPGFIRVGVFDGPKSETSDFGHGEGCSSAVAADPALERAPSSPGPGEGDHPKDGGRGAPGEGFEAGSSPPTAFGGPPSPDGEGCSLAVAADPVPEEAPSSPGPGEGDHAKRGGRGSPVEGFDVSISPPTGFAGPPSPDGEGCGSADRDSPGPDGVPP